MTACGTIIHGTTQDVGISSNPTGAEVTIDNKPHGNTPVTASLSRKDHHTIKIELDGYETYETRLTRNVSGWIAGNIIFGGLIGLAVDAISGGMYKLTPEQVQAQMQKSDVAMKAAEDTMFITFILEPKDDWKKVGSLKKKTK